MIYKEEVIEGQPPNLVLFTNILLRFVFPNSSTLQNIGIDRKQRKALSSLGQFSGEDLSATTHDFPVAGDHSL
jgi:hypothetical protein